MDWSAEDDEEQDSFSLAEWGVELNESANTSGDGVDEIEGKDAPQSESTIPPPTSNLDQLQSPPQQIRATDINTALDTQGPFTSARDAAVSIQPSTSDSPPLPPQSAVTQPTATQETPSKSATSSSTSLHTPNGTPTRKRSPLSKEEQGARMSRLFGGALRGVANARSSESVRVNGVVSGQREGGPPVTNELRQEDPDQEEVATAAALVESSSERPNESEQPTEMPVPVDHSPLPTISATRPQRGRGRGRGGHHKKQTNSQQSKPEDGKLSNPASESTSALMDQQQHAEKPTVKLPVGSAASRWAS